MSEMEMETQADEAKENPVLEAVLACKQESDAARATRMAQNQANYDVYHLKQDWSHKQAGQSQEFLPKQAMAVEQLTSFLQQGLVDLGRWFSLERKVGETKPFLSDDEASAIMQHYLDRADFYIYVSDALKSAMLGSLAIAKCDGTWVEKPEFFVDPESLELKRKKNMVWRPRVQLVRQEDYYPDPTGSGLYEIQRVEIDLHALKEMAEAHPEIWDADAIEEIAAGMTPDNDQEQKKARETSQNIPQGSYRKRVELLEFWGTLLDRNGEVLYRNCQCVIADETTIVMHPRPNPFWHGRSPFVATPLIRVPGSVWHKALADAGTQFNLAMNEQFNLMLDASMQSVFGIRQIRPHWLENADEVSGGIAPGMTLKANLQCPPGQKVFERVDTGSLSSEAVAVYNLTNAEFSQASLTNDLRMGVMPSRTVKATEVVEASQSIQGVLGGVAKNFERGHLQKILELMWLNVMQNANDLDSAEIQALIGEDSYKEFKRLSAKQRFALTAQGYDFSVFGITETLGKMKDFKKLMTLLQTVSASGVLMEEFSKQFDLSKLIGEMVRTLDLNTQRIELDREDMALNTQQGAAGAPAMPGAQNMSQIPQAAAQGEGEAADIPRDEISPGEALQ